MDLQAAQLMRQAHTDHSSLEAERVRGEYATLLKWLPEKAHSHGVKHNLQELMRLATGEGTNSAE